MLGELVSLVVAVSWTATALFGEVASKRMGTMPLNVWRMIVTISLIAILLMITTGSPLPPLADSKVWTWMMLSGLVGFAFGDYCLFNAYVVVGSRVSQLFMTLASPFAAIAAWVLLGETLAWNAILGMIITIAGIATCVTAGKSDKHLGQRLPLKGVLLAIGGGAGQGIGLVISKIGMLHYSELTAAAPDLHYITPFAGTMMRATTGLLCFSLALVLSGKSKSFITCLQDKIGVYCGLGAVLLGPFIGVSLSLLAVQLAPAGIAQTILSLTPVLILWPSKLIFHTPLYWREVVGTFIAVAGVCCFFIS